jgi:hypothetical protein
MRFNSPRGASGGLGHRSRLLLFLIVGLVSLLLVLPVAGLAKGGGGFCGIKLKVQGSHSPVAGTTVRFTADARPANAGSKIMLQQQVAGGDWVTVDTQSMVGMSTAVNFSVAVNENAKYRAKWNGKLSDTVTMWVFARVTVKAQIGTYADGAGTPISISGSVLPASPGRSIKITIQKDGFTIAVIRAPLTPGPNDTSVYAAVWNAMHPGTYKIIASIDKTRLAKHGQAMTTITL